MKYYLSSLAGTVFVFMLFAPTLSDKVQSFEAHEIIGAGIATLFLRIWEDSDD